MRAVVVGRVRIRRVAAAPDWFARQYLHERERALAAAMRIEKRRVDFIAGRVAAKRALARRDVYVLPDDGERSGAPVVFHGGTRLTTPVSIAHGAGWAVAATVESGAIGIDVERIEPRPRSFVDEAFTTGELELWRRRLARSSVDDVVITAAWCAKEALLKRAGVGLRVPLPAVSATAISWIAAPPSGAELAWAECDTDVMGRCALGVQLLPGASLALVIAAGGNGI